MEETGCQLLHVLIRSRLFVPLFSCVCVVSSRVVVAVEESMPIHDSTDAAGVQQAQKVVLH